MRRDFSRSFLAFWSGVLPLWLFILLIMPGLARGAGLTMNPDFAARAVPVWTIDSSDAASVPGGTYSGVVLKPGFTEVDINQGDVVLSGAGGSLISASSPQETPGVVVGSSASPLTLTLGPGRAAGDFSLGAISRSRPATLIADPGQDGKTIVDGNIGSSSFKGSLSVNSGSLVVNGSIGGTPSGAAATLADADATGGDIKTERVSLDKIGFLNARTLTAGAGRTVDIAEHVQVAALFLNENAKLLTRGVFGQDGGKGNGGRIDVHNLIDGGAAGLLGSGAGIYSTGDSVWLWQGVSKGDGEISAGLNIGAHQGLNYYPTQHTMLYDLKQGDGLLALRAGMNISAGDIDVDTIEAGLPDRRPNVNELPPGGAIIAGYEIGQNTAKPEISITAVKNSADYSPLGALNARVARAVGEKINGVGTGGIYAGEVNIVGGSSASLLETGHLLAVKKEADGSLPGSSGNFTLKNGSFALYGAPLNSGVEPNVSANIAYGSQIQGDMTATGNVASSFKTMQIGGRASVDGGTLSGDSLDVGGPASPGAAGAVTGAGENAGNAAFTNLDRLTIADSLYATKNLTVAGERTASGVKTATIGGTAEVSGLSYSGDTLTVGASATFANLSGLTLDTLLKTGEDLTINGAATVSQVKIASVGGSAAVGGQSYAGDELTASGSASFNNLATLTINNNLTATAGDATISGGQASVAALAAGQNFTLSDGTYKGASVTTGGDAILSSVPSFNATDSTTIGGKLTSTNGGALNFGVLSVGEGATASGGKLSATSIETGAKSGATGDATISGGSFAFGGSSHIRGALTATDNAASSFGDLTVDGAASVAGGSVQGARLTVNGVELSKLTSFAADDVNSGGDLNVDAASAKAGSATATGAAHIRGGVYEGGDLSAASAIFSNLKTVSLSGKLGASGDIELGMAEGGDVKIARAEAGGDFTASGGSATLGSLTVDGSGSFVGANATVNGATTIGGDLSVSGANNKASFDTLSVGGAASLTDASLAAATIETGAKTGSGGDFTVSGAGSFDLGSGGAPAGTIHGNLTLTGPGSSSFTDLAVDQTLNMSGGYLEGDSLAAQVAVFKNNSLAHIDKLVLSAAPNPLQIEDGSVVVVREILAQTGSQIVNDSGLIIAGDPDDPNSWSRLGDVDLTQGVMAAEKALVQVNSITGSGQGANADDIKAHSLRAVDVNIQNANLRLTGVAEYASSVAGDLTILNNGDTRLGDATVGGQAEISGGTVAARGLTIKGDAMFDGVGLSLAGTGEKGGSVGGNLTLANSASASLGDMSVGGMLTALGAASGGTFTAGVLTSGQGALFNNIDVSMNGTERAPGHIGGDLRLIANKSASLGFIHIDGGLAVEGGTLTADALKVGGDATLTGVKTTLTGSKLNPDEFKGNLTVTDNRGANLGYAVVAGDLRVDGAELTADGLQAGGDATLTGVALTLNGTSGNPDSVGGDLIINDNQGTTLGYLTVGGDLTASGDELTATSVKIDGGATLTGVGVTLNGTSDNRDEIKGALTINGNKGANLAYLTVGGDLTVSGDKLVATSLKTGGNASFSGAVVSLNGTSDNPDEIKGNLTIEDNRGATLKHIRVGGDLSASGGALTVDSLKVGRHADLSGVSLILKGSAENPDEIPGNLTLTNNQGANLGYLNVGGTAKVDGGEFVATSLASGNLAFNDARSSVASLNVAGSADFARGELRVGQMTTGGANFGDGLIAAFKRLTLKDASGAIAAGSAADPLAGVNLKIDRLSLAGGALSALNAGATPTLVAVGSFASANIDGRLGVGANGRVVLGSMDAGWVPASLADARATLALVQPMRLDASAGIHATGAGAPAPVAGRIVFDSDSLFVIDGSDPRLYYTGQWIKSAQLGSGQGALSSASGHTATINPGAQIYIRNPVPNTVIVALGENIRTTYADATSRAAGSGGWTGINLAYDNKDAVKIERLEGDYAGQFSVLPREPEKPDNPSQPGQPENPNPPDNPDKPTQPGGSDNPSQPDNPDKPNQPGGSDNPSQPDNPDKPNQPGGSDNPNQPDNPDNPGGSDQPSGPNQPDNPDQPDNPNQPGEQPSGTDKPAKKPAKPQETHPGADGSIHHVVANDPNVGDQPHQIRPDTGAGFISGTIVHDSPTEASRLVEGAARTIILGGVPQMTLLANEAAASAVGQRAGLENLLWRDEDFHARSFALWAVPLYRASSAWSFEAGNYDYDYRGGVGGVALGGDVTFANLARAGLSFHIGSGYSKSTGDLAETTNNMNFWGLGAYAGWARDNFGVSADASFTSSYNKLKQEVSNLPGWSELKADARSAALSAGLKFEYRFVTDWLDVIPHAGFKYHYLHVFDYDVNHRGAEIIEGRAFDQNLWTFPIGLKLAREFNLDSGWRIKPSVDFQVIPAAGDVDVKTSVRFTDTSSDIDLKTKTMDYFTFGGTAGVEATLGAFTLGLNYNVSAGAQSVSNSVFGVLRYEF